VALIPIPCGRSLCPVKNRGSFVKGVDQLSLIFYWTIKTFNNTPFYFPLFLLSSYFSIYSLNKTFPLKGKKAQNGGGKLESNNGGTSGQNWGKLRPISIPDLVDKSRCKPRSTLGTESDTKCNFGAVSVSVGCTAMSFGILRLHAV